MVSADRRCRRGTATQFSARYGGAKSCKHLKTITEILYCIRQTISNVKIAQYRCYVVELPILVYQSRHVQPNSGRSGSSWINRHWCRTNSKLLQQSRRQCWRCMHQRISRFWSHALTSSGRWRSWKKHDRQSKSSWYVIGRALLSWPSIKRPTCQQRRQELDSSRQQRSTTRLSLTESLSSYCLVRDHIKFAWHSGRMLVFELCSALDLHLPGAPLMWVNRPL